MLGHETGITCSGGRVLGCKCWRQVSASLTANLRRTAPSQTAWGVRPSRRLQHYLKLMWNVCNFVCAIVAYTLCHAQVPKDPVFILTTHFTLLCTRWNFFKTVSTTEFESCHMVTMKYVVLLDAITCSLVDTWSLLRMTLEIHGAAL